MAPSSSGPGRPQWHERRTAPHAIGEHSSSTARWNDVPRGTMDEVSSFVRLDLPSLWRQGRHLDCSASSSNPIMEGPWCRFRREARARERHRHRSDGSLKALDPDRPIREADNPTAPAFVRYWSNSGHQDLTLMTATVSIGSTHALLPEFDYSGREFTPPDACASASFRPHFK